MRTTIDLPSDLLALVKDMARRQGVTLSQAVAQLMRRGIDPPMPAEISTSPISGLPVIKFGGPPITQVEVDAVEDEGDEYLMSFVRPRKPA